MTSIADERVVPEEARQFAACSWSGLATIKVYDDSGKWPFELQLGELRYPTSDRIRIKGGSPSYDPRTNTYTIKIEGKATQWHYVNDHFRGELDVFVSDDNEPLRTIAFDYRYSNDLVSFGNEPKCGG